MFDKRYIALDIAAKDSRYTDPNANVPDYDLRAIISYCKAKGIETAQLTEEELKPFIRKANAA